MEKINHTPGPWKFYEREAQDLGELPAHVVAAPNGCPLAVLENYCGLEREANARLIAAAPETAKELEYANELLGKAERERDEWKVAAEGHCNGWDQARKDLADIRAKYALEYNARVAAEAQRDELLAASHDMAMCFGDIENADVQAWWEARVPEYEDMPNETQIRNAVIERLTAAIASVEDSK